MCIDLTNEMMTILAEIIIPLQKVLLQFHTMLSAHEIIGSTHCPVCVTKFGTIISPTEVLQVGQLIARCPEVIALKICKRIKLIRKRGKNYFKKILTKIIYIVLHLKLLRRRFNADQRPTILLAESISRKPVQLHRPLKRKLAEY